MRIKKRFGARSFVDCLHLNYVFYIGTKPRKEQQVFLKGGFRYVYKTKPAEKKALDIQKAYSIGQPGPWKKIYAGPTYPDREVSDGVPMKLRGYPKVEMD